MSQFFFSFLNKVVKIIGGGSVIDRPTLSSFLQPSQHQSCKSLRAGSHCFVSETLGYTEKQNYLFWVCLFWLGVDMSKYKGKTIFFLHMSEKSNPKSIIALLGDPIPLRGCSSIAHSLFLGEGRGQAKV